MKIFRFVKRVFFVGLTILSDFTNAISLNTISLSCISMKNQECKTRPHVVNVNGDGPVFFPFSIEKSKLKVKMSRMNETTYTEWHGTCKCESKFGENVCNNKQRWNKNKCRCEWKELINKGVCDKGFIWNPSNCECECDKACDIGKYLDYEYCKCRKKIVDRLVNECTDTVEEVKLAKITLARNKNNCKCSSCTVYTVLFWIFFTINVGGIGAYFIYFRGYLRKMFTREKTIY